MLNVDVLILGGGPAGSTCAWRLRRLGIECIIVDKEEFPRGKPCGGWITPEVMDDLEMDVNAYPYGVLSFHRLWIHIHGLSFRVDTLQHSIRRCEFDHWLIERAKVPVFRHRVRTLRQEQGRYIVDDRFRCRYLVGAGGSGCPVRRAIFKPTNAHARVLQVTALEQEFPYAYEEGDCHLWFFDRALPGYAWYVPKADGYLNVGLGAMASQLRRSKRDIRDHWRHLECDLGCRSWVKDHEFEPTGYSYYLRDNIAVGQIGRAFVIGDAAGLATRDLAEGIGPAVRSGLLAAEAIASRKPFSLDPILRRSINSRLLSWPLEYMFVNRSERGARG